MNPPLPSGHPTSRRKFVQAAALGTAALALAPTFNSSAKAAPDSVSTDSAEDPIFMSATKLAGLIRTKKISSVEATKAYLARIAAVNGKINAVVTLVSDRALLEAGEA